MARRKKKQVPWLGMMIGMGLWGSLTYAFYPGWPAWVFGGLLGINVMATLLMSVTYK